MVYRNDNPEDRAPDDAGDAHEPRGCDPRGADGPEDDRFDLRGYAGPSAEDIERSERPVIEPGTGGRWLKTAGAVLLVLAALGLLLSLIGPVAFSRGGDQQRNAFEVARVQQVVDGNTIIVSLDGRPETVRYIGISVGATGGSLHRTSRLANQSWVEGASVVLERDVEDRDAEGRLLRYVYVNNQMVNAVLVNSGLARYAPGGANQRYDNVLLAAETAARQGKRGLWAESGDQETTST